MPDEVRLKVVPLSAIANNHLTRQRVQILPPLAIYPSTSHEVGVVSNLLLTTFLCCLWTKFHKKQRPLVSGESIWSWEMLQLLEISLQFSKLSYIDPGSGSAILSAIIGFFVVIGLTIKSFWYKIKSVFSRKSSSDEDVWSLNINRIEAWKFVTNHNTKNTLDLNLR